MNSFFARGFRLNILAIIVMKVPTSSTLSINKLQRAKNFIDAVTTTH